MSVRVGGGQQKRSGRGIASKIFTEGEEFRDPARDGADDARGPRNRAMVLFTQASAAPAKTRDESRASPTRAATPLSLTVARVALG